MEVALVLQGGGALGAYEYGAVAELVRNGIKPKIVTGVSIGAINSAAIAGAKHGDVVGSLTEIWGRLTLDLPKFLPVQLLKNMALLGNPNFYHLRTDWWDYHGWTSFCDTRPIHKTLQQEIDWDRLNDTTAIRIAVTAVNVATGVQTTFSNTEKRLDSRHIIASGSLPPGFPATLIDGQYYWDGGLFDNTPLLPLFDLLTEDEIDNLPIIIVDLVPNADHVPKNLDDVRNRMMELSFENRFWHEHGGHKGIVEHARILDEIDKLVPVNHPLRGQREYQRMMDYCACKNLHVITPVHQVMSEGHDFSPAGIEHRYQSGVAAARSFLDRQFGKKAPSSKRRSVSAESLAERVAAVDLVACSRFRNDGVAAF
jgi:NTE family protein